MTEHRYSKEERRQQLRELAATLPRLVATVSALPQLRHLNGRYELALDEVGELLRNGFDQAQLSELGRSIPDAFARHKEWVPPLERTLDGQLREPDWFVELENSLQPVLRTARILCELGYY